MIKLISERDLELGHVAVAAFDSLLKAASNEIAQSNARLFARVPEPGNLQEGVTYDVDLKRGWFEHSNLSGVVTFGPAHPIGTFLPETDSSDEGKFLWAWHNPSISADVAAPIRDAVSREPNLSALAAIKGFGCARSFAGELSAFIAQRIGYLGCYPAPFDRATVYLALKLSVHSQENFAFGEAGNIWCVNCGWAASSVGRIVRGVHGYICDECAPCLNTMLTDIAAVGQDAAKADVTTRAVQDLGVRCMFCDEGSSAEDQLVFLQYTAVHPSCVQIASDVVRDATPKATP